MAAYAGSIDICCDGCGKRLSEDSEIYCLGCRQPLDDKTISTITSVRNSIGAARLEIVDIRVALDVLIDAGLIAPVDVRDQLQAISARLGALTE